MVSWFKILENDFHLFNVSHELGPGVVEVVFQVPLDGSEIHRPFDDLKVTWGLAGLHPMPEDVAVAKPANLRQ